MIVLRKAFAEFLGTGTLVATVIGSGAMAANLTKDVCLQLFINTVATVFILYIIITIFGPVSGAHFNLLITGIELFRKKLDTTAFSAYLVAQLSGGAFGALLANAMFELPLVNISEKMRSGGHLFLGEIIATSGLIFIIYQATHLGLNRKLPRLIAAWIGAAYFFTSSTSFANPAVTLARTLSDTFAGIDPSSAPAFIAAQVIGAALGLTAFAYLSQSSFLTVSKDKKKRDGR